VCGNSWPRTWCGSSIEEKLAEFADEVDGAGDDDEGSGRGFSEGAVERGARIGGGDGVDADLGGASGEFFGGS
jgi:hypothetical protein